MTVALSSPGTSRVWLWLAVVVSMGLLSHAVRAAGVEPGRATPVQREQAQARFVRGKQLYGRKDYAGAAEEFNAAIEIVGSPNARLYLARCYRESGRLVAAYVEFGRTEVEAREYAREDPRYTRTGESAAAERRALASKLGFVTVHVASPTDSTTLRVAHDDIRRAAWGEPVPVLPGVTEAVVETPPSPPIVRSITISAGESKSIDIDSGEPAVAPAVAAVAPPHTTRRILRPIAWGAAAVGAAGLLTFGVAGLLSDAAYSNLRSSCPAGACPPSKAGEISSGRTEQIVANAGLVIGIVGASAAATLFLVSLPINKEKNLALFVSPVGAGLGGAF